MKKIIYHKKKGGGLPKPYFETGLGKLYHGDCLEIMPHLEKVDLVLTDPPYGVEVDYDNYKDTYERWLKLTALWLPMALTKTSKGLIMTPGGYEQERFLWMHYPPKWRICWYKRAQSQRSPVGFKHWENVFVYGDTKSQCPDYFEAAPQKWNGHPVPKPISFYLWFLKRFSEKGNVVLDPFVGSGTFCVSCERLARRWVAIEKSKKYCEIIVKRVKHEMDSPQLFDVEEKISKVIIRGLFK